MATVDEGMREAVALKLYEMAPFATPGHPGVPLPWSELPEWATDRFLSRADVLIAGPIASALAARERERDEARARAKAANRRADKADKERKYFKLTRRAEHEARVAAETELATLRASAERMEAAATLALAELDWQATASAHCGDPNHECPMQDIHAPSDGHSIARSALRAALTPKEPDHG